MKPTSKGLRDLFFIAWGSAILYQQFFLREDPSPLGVFAAFVLIGLVPAFRADEGATSGPLAILLHVLAALGAKAPQVPPADPEGREAPAGREARGAGPEDKADPAAKADPAPEPTPPESKGPGGRS